MGNGNPIESERQPALEANCDSGKTDYARENITGSSLVENKKSHEDANEFSSNARIGILARFGIAMIRQYQRFLSPFLGGQCRFYPSCSQYGILAIKKHGAILGSLKTVGRICRCQPFCKGGIDYP